MISGVVLAALAVGVVSCMGAVMPSGAPVVIDGLLTPRSIAFDQAGDMYVSDSGDAKSGQRGRVLLRAPDGSTRTVLTTRNEAGDVGTLSYSNGVAGIGTEHGILYVALGAGAWLDHPLTAPDRLVSLDPVSGKIDTLFDFGRLEREENPDGGIIDSNASGLAIATDGTFWVTDAAGNWAAHLSQRGDVLAVVAFPAANGAEAVPTSVVAGDNGSAYVTLFRCTNGDGGIARIAADGTWQVIVAGLHQPIAVLDQPDGSFLVLEFSVGYAPRTGRLLRLSGADRRVLAEALNYPTAMAIGPGGELFVAEMASTGISGQIIKVHVD